MKYEILRMNDKYYPEKLKKIYAPPGELYVLGDKTILDKKSVAVIGCRECSSYGANIAKKLSYELSKKGINIVSGLARGIDTYAHIGTVKAGMKTIAVLGSGLDNIYPYENKGLCKEIIKNGGAIITEFPLGTKPYKINFPMRNRIISGLSDGIVVVEAKEKSGTLITVEYGLEQGKDIFVVPGNITSENSYGTNRLIQEGAKLVLNVDDIISEI